MKTAILVLCAVVMAASASASTIVGGTSSAGITDPDIQGAANFVLASANSNKCQGLCDGLLSDGELKSVEVKSATKQVVAGMLYKMDLIVTDSNGKKSAVTASVWSRPWLAAKNDAAEPATKITELTFNPLGGTDA